MTQQEPTTAIKGYCAQCSCYCRIISYVEDGPFTEVRTDKEHPLASPICVKGKTGPELNLPGYDPYYEDGANVNRLYNAQGKDPVSSSLPLKDYPYNVKKR